MSRLSHLQLPFFDAPHQALAAELDGWAAARLPGIDRHDVDGACRRLVQALGQGGFLRHAVPAAFGGARAAIEARSLVVCRETLARHDGLADFAFAMQGLGSAPLSLAGSPALQEAVLPRIARGECIAALALAEPGAGADLAAIACSARDEGEHWVLDGEKTWIGQGGIADVYCVFARSEGSGAEPGQAPRSTEGLSAFLVPAGTLGCEVAGRPEVMSPRPLARLRLRQCRIPKSQRIGAAGEGFVLAQRTLALFRPAVAAAALGLARRALDEALAHSRARGMFGRQLADFQLTQAALGDMATAIDAAALLGYRAAWRHDLGAQAAWRHDAGDGAVRDTAAHEAAMAQLCALRNAQRVVDHAQQLHGGEGLRVGSVVERLQRELRSLAIEAGASEVQRLGVGRDLLDT